MANFRIKSYLGITDYSITYQGKPGYNLKSGFNVQFCDSPQSYYGGCRDEYLILSQDRHLVLNYTSVCNSGTGPKDYYCYYIIPRIPGSGIITEYVPEVAEYLLKYLPSQKHLKDLLHRFFGLLLDNYDEVITDIPGIGGKYVGEMYDDHSNLWGMNYKEVVELNTYRVLINSCRINLNKFHRKKTIVLLTHNSELAFDIAQLIGDNAIPVVLLGSNV